jgi:peptidoglycan/xylan/chitin deacetylase (PgdA/CDA1 family)
MRVRLAEKWRRMVVARWGRRDHLLRTNVPYISFTFDDFPRSAFVHGGRILAARGVHGTYFVALKLLDRPSPSGPIASVDDVKTLIREGHELGCHTFDHADGRSTPPAAFERSIVANREALQAIIPGAELPVFAYPLNGPQLAVKRSVGRHFLACRGGGQTFNTGLIDLNLLNAFFLDHRNWGRLDTVQSLIKRNSEARGWLIFATHDIASDPSPYGCAPGFFSDVVDLAIASGARVLPMARVCDELHDAH